MKLVELSGTRKGISER